MLGINKVAEMMVSIKKAPLQAPELLHSLTPTSLILFRHRLMHALFVLFFLHILALGHRRLMRFAARFLFGIRGFAAIARWVRAIATLPLFTGTGWAFCEGKCAAQRK